MRRRLCFSLIVVLLAGGCEYREVVPVRSDGSTALSIGVEVEPGDQPSGGADDATDDGCELCGLFMPLVILIVVLFGILALGVLAATLGLFEAVRVTRRDRRDTSRPDGSP